jgi:kynurenine formamidase
MELDFFFGPAVLINVSGKQSEEEITLEDVRPYESKIGADVIVLFRTDWYKHRGEEIFFAHPYVSEEVAAWLVDKGIRFIGIDTINADKTGGTEFPVHDLFSEKRLMIGENWAYFDRIDFENIVISAFPMKITGTDGSPVRAVAMEIE